MTKTIFSALAPAVVGLVLAIPTRWSARPRRGKMQAEGVFRFPGALIYLLAGFGALFLSAAFWPGAAGGMGQERFFWEMSPFWMEALLAAIMVHAVLPWFRFEVTALLRSRRNPDQEIE